jgi:two-component system nitrogen regulation response regulator GlnG/two-component system response regulator HydG
VLALVVAWCPQEPFRVGEVAVFPPAEASRERILGRGAPDPADERLRLEFGRHRPGELKPSPPLDIASISRAQLSICVCHDARLALQNVGKASLRINGEEAQSAEVGPGDIIQLGRQLLLLCTRRPAWLPANASSSVAHPFGEPDADGMVGESWKMWELRQALAFAAGRSDHVLIVGPSGTGKELVARAMHERSSRSKGPFVARNAATIPDGLIDAELFGHAKNYPNAGMAERVGLVGEADGGSLFLDEFGELPSSHQAHLLRVLDAGEYQRLGEARRKSSQFRLIAATNRDSSALKHDILARLALRVQTPSLNECREDIPFLVAHLLQRIAREAIHHGIRAMVGSWKPRIPLDLMCALLMRDYQTNVRELFGLLLEAHRYGNAEELCLPPRASTSQRNRESTEAASGLGHRADEVSASPDWPAESPPLTAERIQACLDEHNGALELTWKALGLPNRHVLRRLIEKHRLVIRKRPRPRH